LENGWFAVPLERQQRQGNPLRHAWLAHQRQQYPLATWARVGPVSIPARHINLPRLASINGIKYRELPGSAPCAIEHKGLININRRDE
jgi:hypothetical protein